ncbi:DUF1176 domain-containing protein [Propylenella binzhouense]|uniref:DUF1176 domain-containing protein n=1 Tax=Propylenella binzhouense TaxID=2555902 RepID=A0A964T6Q2_9HYPH|nr:DUF1176 domain-containing protein [Propylenella binzhouense]MYZ48839.1 DUF1176 domain-containing protein [Propylenella binzhouense]
MPGTSPLSPRLPAALLALALAGGAAGAQEGTGAPAEAGGIPPDSTIGMVLAKHAESGCEDPGSEHMKRIPGLVSTLSPTATLFAVPCTASGPNTTYRLYVRESGEVGGLEVLKFATWTPDHGWTGTDLLYNIEIEGPRLRARFKAAPKGDCGTYAEWTWADYAYRLDRFAAEPDCRGRAVADWPIVYPPQ